MPKFNQFRDVTVEMGRFLREFYMSSHCICTKCCRCCLVTSLCLTLCDPTDCSPPGSSVHGISSARKLEWVAISFSRGSSQLRVWTWVYLHCRQILYWLSYKGNPVIKWITNEMTNETLQCSIRECRALWWLQREGNPERGTIYIYIRSWFTLLHSRN